jgi:hypothetical protein
MASSKKKISLKKPTKNRVKRDKKSKRDKRSKSKKDKRSKSKRDKRIYKKKTKSKSSCLKKGGATFEKYGATETLTFKEGDGKIMCDTFNRLYKKYNKTQGNNDKFNINNKMKIKIQVIYKFNDSGELTKWVSNDTYWNKYKNHIKFMIEKDNGTYNLYIMERDATNYSDLIHMNDKIVHNPETRITEDFV